MKIRIKTGFTKYRDNDLPVKAQKIHDDMTDDIVDYPSPVPSLSSGQTLIDAYVKALANRGSTAKTAAKNTARNAVIDFLNALALYVQANCGNDATTALNSGYDIKKVGSPVGDLPKPKGFTLGAGSNSGEVDAACDSMGDHAKSYIFIYSQVEGSDPSTWLKAVSTTPKVIIAGLVSGQKLSVKCAGVGASKHLVWSNTISIYVM